VNFLLIWRFLLGAYELIRIFVGKQKIFSIYAENIGRLYQRDGICATQNQIYFESNGWINREIPDFKLSPCSECFMLSSR